MKRVFGLFTLLLVLGFVWLSPVQANERGNDPLLAQAGSACRTLNQSCGIPAGTSGLINPACCNGLWCQNGVCVNTRRAGEPCGSPANPPCGSGLACVNQRCQ